VRRTLKKAAKPWELWVIAKEIEIRKVRTSCGTSAASATLSVRDTILPALPHHPRLDQAHSLMFLLLFDSLLLLFFVDPFERFGEPQWPTFWASPNTTKSRFIAGPVHGDHSTLPTNARQTAIGTSSLTKFHSMLVIA
jgi:hypothetical protein